jgi:anti-sigma factor RsiW
MSDVRKDEIARLSMRRELTPDEESRLELYFAANPGARAEWEEERALGRALQSLPDAPLSSNFTSRVLQEVELEQAREERQEQSAGSWFSRFFPKLGWATTVALVAALFLQYRSINEERTINDRARALAGLSTAPAPELLQDFEVIERLRWAAVPSDDELLTALVQ